MMRRSFRNAVQAWWLPLSIAIVCAVLAALADGDDRWHRWLDYRRSAVADGEWWRLVSGHLVHWTGSHATLDIAGLLLVAWTFSTALRPRDQIVVCAIAVAAIDAALWLAGVDRYVGLSGVLHAWFAAGATRWAVSPNDSSDGAPSRTAERAWGMALLAALTIKLAIEARAPAPWLPGADFPVLASAHRWGAAAGVVSGLLLARISRPRRDAAVAASPDPRPPVR